MRALFAIFLLPALWLMLGHSNFQDKERLFDRKMQRNEPVQLEEIQVRDTHGRKKVQAGVKFHGDEDWVKGVTLKLKNLTEKPIVYLEAKVYVPTSDTEDHPVVLS